MFVLSSFDYFLYTTNLINTFVRSTLHHTSLILILFFPYLFFFVYDLRNQPFDLRWSDVTLPVIRYFALNNKSGSISNIDGGEYHCNKTQVRKVISGVVGAASSVTSIQVANLLRLFRIPQVSNLIFSYLGKVSLMFSFVISDFYFYLFFLLILPF